MKDQIKVILLTKGIPIRFWADGNRQASVDAPLCYLGNISTAGNDPTGSFAADYFTNPYYSSDTTFSVFRGATVNDTTAEFPDVNNLNTFASGVVVAVGDHGLIVRSTDEMSWQTLNDSQRNFTGSPITAVASSGAYGWAVCGSFYDGSVNRGGRIMRSVDNGASWACVQDTSPGTSLSDVSFADTNNGWAVGSQNGSPLILHTENSGTWGSWAQLQPVFLGPYSTTVTGVCATGTDGAVVCGSNGIVLTVTSPASLWSLAADVSTGVTYNSVALVPSDGTYIGWVVGDGGTIFKTTDSGSSWQQQESLFTGSLKKVCAFDADHAWITTGTNTLLKTTDGGSTWNIVTLPTGQTFASVSFVSSFNGFGVSGKTIFSTADGGSTWFPTFVGQDTDWRVNYLTCRLDGYQNSEPTHANDLPVDIKRMIDDSAQTDSSGCFVFDRRMDSPGSGYWEGEQWMIDANSQLSSMGIESALDATYTYLTGIHSGSIVGGHTLTDDVMGYCSWGSNDGNSCGDTQWAKPLNTWKRGSVSTTHVSSSGRTFNYPPDYAIRPLTLTTYQAPSGMLRIGGVWQGWQATLHDNDTGLDVSAKTSGWCIDLPLPSAITNGHLTLYYEDGTPIPGAEITTGSDTPLAPGVQYSTAYQSLAVDLLHEGCDASIGNVFEPQEDSCGQPQYIFPRYASGYTWAEASYTGLQHGGWMENSVGDPLMAAYATPPSVTLTSPSTNGAVISGTAYTVTATATPNNAPGINRVEFWLTDGHNVDALIATDTSAPYSITFDTTTLPAPYSQGIADGRYILEAIAYENTNIQEVGLACRPIVINNGGSPTSVSIASPAVDGTVLSGAATVAVTATPSTPPSTSRVDLWLHGSGRDKLVGSLVSAPFNFQFDTTSVPDGVYDLQAVSYSSTGQASASTIRLVTVNNANLIQITTPSTDGQVKSGVFAAEATVSGTASVSSVEFWLGQGVDQGVLVSTGTAAPYSCSIDSVTFPDGDYVIRALAYTTGTSPAVNFARRAVTFSNSSLLAFTTPATDGQTVSGNLSVQVTAGITTPPITQVDLWPIGVADSVVTSTDTTSPFNWTIDTTTIPNGTYSMRVDAKRQSGTEIASHPARAITVNNANLLAVITPSSDGLVLSGSDAALEISAAPTTPNYGSIRIYFSGESNPWVIEGGPDSSGNYTYSFDTTNYPNGIHTITVYAYKPDGRRIANSVATRTFLINNQYPNCHNIQNARRLSDGSGLMLQDKVVSAGTGGPMGGTFYIEEPDQLSGLRVVWSGSTVPTSKLVTILGTIGSNSNTGERQITADVVYVGSDATPIQPVGMGNKAIGGTAPTGEFYTTSVSTSGAYNTGVLVKVWGAVTTVGNDFFYIDDGSKLQDGNIRGAQVVIPMDGSSMPTTVNPIGLRVYCGSLGKPNVEDYVSVAGISSMLKIGGTPVRCVRMRQDNDVSVSQANSYYQSYTKVVKEPLWSWSDWETSNPEHPFIGQFVDPTLAHITTGSEIRMTNSIVESQTVTSSDGVLIAATGSDGSLTVTTGSDGQPLVATGSDGSLLFGTNASGVLTFRQFDPSIHPTMSGDIPGRTGKKFIPEVKTMWWPVFADAITRLSRGDALTIFGTTAMHSGYTLDDVTDEWIIPDRIYKRYRDGTPSNESAMNRVVGMMGGDLGDSTDTIVDASADTVPGEVEPGGGPVGPDSNYDDSDILQADWFLAADSQTGAIGWALAKQDGAVFDLPGEHVVQVLEGGQTLAIKEWFEPGTPNPRLVLRLGTAVQGLADNACVTIDIVGATLTTLPDGRRALINPTAVNLYVDEDGNIAPPIPPGKDVGSILLSWQWKRQIAP